MDINVKSSCLTSFLKHTKPNSHPDSVLPAAKTMKLVWNLFLGGIYLPKNLMETLIVVVLQSNML